MAHISLKFYKHVHNIHLEGTVSQIFFYLGLTFDVLLKKTGRFSGFFQTNFLNLIKKQKTTET